MECGRTANLHPFHFISFHFISIALGIQDETKKKKGMIQQTYILLLRQEVPKRVMQRFTKNKDVFSTVNTCINTVIHGDGQVRVLIQKMITK